MRQSFCDFKEEDRQEEDVLDDEQAVDKSHLVQAIMLN